MNKIVRILFFFKYRSNIATLMSSDKKISIIQRVKN